MISQDFQNPAIRGAPPAAFFDHAPQLRAKSLQPNDTLFDVPKLPTGDFVGFMARLIRIVAEFDQLSDGIKRETQLA